MSVFNPSRYVFVDTETTGIRPWHGDRPFAFPMCDEEGNTWYTEWRVDPYTRQVLPDMRDASFIQKILGDPKITKVCYNLSFDYRMLQKSGFHIEGPVQDVFYAARVINNNELTYGLKPLSKKYAGFPDDDEKELADYVKKLRLRGKKLGYRVYKFGDHPYAADYWMPRVFDSSNNLCEEYATKDAIRTAVLFFMYQEAMAADQNQREAYELEMNLWPITYQMEERGLCFDMNKNLDELEKYHEKLNYHLDRCREAMWPHFNPGSPPQLREALYGKLGLECHHYTEAGNKGTNWKALREHASIPFVRDVIGWRAGKQAITLFFWKYVELAVPDHIATDHYVLHPSIDQAGARTGRESCRQPNLQQVANSDTAARIAEPIGARSPFMPRPGFCWIHFDYSQQETRIFAHVAQATRWIEDIRCGRDINDANSNRAWGGKDNPAAPIAASYALDFNQLVPAKAEVQEAWDKLGWDADKSATLGPRSQEAFEKAMEWMSWFDYDIVKAEKSLGKKATRTRAKMILFAKIYGGGPLAVADLLFCTHDEARFFMNQFDEAEPAIGICMANLEKSARRNGYIETAFGRKLQVEHGFEYKATNYYVQGTAAGQLKMAQLRAYEYLKSKHLLGHWNPLLPVHDEVIFEVELGYVFKNTILDIKHLMEDNQGKLSVPSAVEVSRTVAHWDVKEEIKL